MDGEDGVRAVVLAAEHLLGLGGLDLGLELVEPALEIGADVFPGRGPFEQHADVVGAALQRLAQGEVALDAPPPLHHFLRLGLAAPEVGRGGQAFDFVELGLEAGTLKDTSAARASAG